MSGWEDIVTTALLGTDRRPVPAAATHLLDLWGVPLQPEEADPASAVLDVAAAHRTLGQAGAALSSCPAPLVAPPDRLEVAPLAAQDVLAGLLARPAPGLVNIWMATAEQRCLGVAVEHWARLAQLASHDSAYDRALLVTVLGPRGVWFLGQHPQWSRLVAAPTPSTRPHTRAAETTGDPADVLTYANGGESPTLAFEMILARPDPLPTALVAAALQLLAGGALGPDSRSAATALGYRIPLSFGPALREWVRSVQCAHRAAEQSVELVVRAVAARSQIDDAFAEHQPPGGTPP